MSVERMGILYYKQDPENEAEWLDRKTHPAKMLREGKIVVFVPHGAKLAPIPPAWSVVMLAHEKD